MAAISPRRPGLLGARPVVRVAAAALAAVVVAELAVWLLRPRGAIVDPSSLPAEAFFSRPQLDRAADFRGGQRLIAVATLIVEGAVLVVLALWRPAPLRAALRRASRRPLLGAAAVAAGISLTLAIAALPLGIASHERARDVGLATQALAPWLADAGKSALIGAVLAALGGIAAVAMMRRLGGRWWIGGSAVVVAFAVVFTWLAPVVLDPVFNRFEDLPRGRTRAEVVRLGDRAGVKIGDVYRVDASRRSTALNAYVGGLGSTKRVVIYDNALRELSPAELRSVLAHELGHVKGDDVPRGILWVALVAPLALLFIQLAAEGLARRSGDESRSPAGLPAVALAMAVAIFVLGSVSSQLSRRVEARADTFALELTRDPDAFVDLQRQLAIANVSDPAPPGLFQSLFGTHPDTMQRIGAARAFGREARR